MPIRILLLEDSASDAELIARQLKRDGLEAMLRVVTGRDAYLRELEGDPPDLIISDHTVPQFGGRAALDAARRQAPEAPFILVTGSLDDEIAVDYMKAGASDYLLKDRITRLGSAVRGALDTARERAERARAEAARQESEERRARVALASNDVLWDLSLTGGQLWWNAGADHRFVSPAESDVDRGWWEQQIHPDDRGRVAAALREALAGGASTWVAEYRLLQKDGGYSEVVHRASITRDAEGTATRVVGAIMDDSTRRRLEEQLRLAQKMEAIGTLAGGIAHDFNNLLAALRSTVDLTLLDTEPTHPLRRDLEQIRTITQRAAALTGQLLAFGRKQILDPRPVDLGSLCAETVSLLGRLLGENVRVSVQCPVDPATVLADPGQVEQVLMNLCVNARDAMPAGGDLSVEVDRVSLDQVDVARMHTLAPGEYLRLSVRDSGLGMDEATRLRIFEPFFTTKEMGRGTGLGLAVVYGIVKQHGGWIEVESAPGKGTTFRVLFPAAAAVPRGMPEAGPEPGRRGETVLLAEDDDALRSAEVRLLERLGYTVLAAANGAEALKLVALHGGRIDLMILDVVMPGLSGPAIRDQLQVTYPGLKFLFTTGHVPGPPGAPSPVDGLRAPVLSKPYGISELAQAVRRVLEGQVIYRNRG